MSDTFSPSNAMHQETGWARQKEASRDFHRRPRRARHLIYRPRWWWRARRPVSSELLNSSNVRTGLLGQGLCVGPHPKEPEQVLG